jgi:hypothetical protein
MIKKSALVFSYLLHPLLMTTAGIIFILYSETYMSYLPADAKRMLIILVAIGTMFLPAIMVPLFMIRGLVSNVNIEDQRERVIPMAITLVFYVLTYILFLRMPVYKFIHAYILGSALAVLAGFLLNFRWKISAHMIGLGGITSLLVMTSLVYRINLLGFILVALLASGIAGSSRLLLEAHKPYEIYLGWLTGFVIMAVVLLS